VAGRGRQRAGYELAQLAVAEHDDAVRRAHGDLLEDFQGRRERLDEDRRLVADRGRNQVKIRDWERQIFGEGPVAAEDTQHGTRRAVPPQSSTTGPARAARGIDLPNDPLATRFPHRLRPVAERDDLADELVAGS